MQRKCQIDLPFPQLHRNSGEDLKLSRNAIRELLLTFWIQHKLPLCVKDRFSDEWFRQGGKGGIYIGCKSPICRNKCLVFVGRWGKRATDGASDALSRTWGKHSRGRLAKINLTLKVTFVKRQIFSCEGRTMTGMDVKIALGYSFASTIWIRWCR